MENSVGYLQIKIRELNEEVETLKKEIEESKNKIEETKKGIQSNIDNAMNSFAPLFEFNKNVEGLLYQSERVATKIVNEQLVEYKKYIESRIFSEFKTIKGVAAEANKDFLEMLELNISKEIIGLHARINNLIDILNKKGINIIETKIILEGEAKDIIKKIKRIRRKLKNRS